MTNYSITYSNRQMLVMINVLVLLYYSPVLLNAQSGQYNYNQINIDNGLTSNNITHIVQDSIGFIWMGSEYGLNRYDGYEIKRYFTREYDTSSISSNYIEDLFFDQKGRMWIGTLKGVSRYDYDLDIFHNYSLNNGQEIIGSNYVTSIDTDVSGRIWVSNLNGDLFYFNSASNSFVEYQFDGLRDNDVHDIKIDSANNLWIGYQNGLARLNISNKDFKFFPITQKKNKNVNINEVLIKDGNIWAVAYKIGLHKFNLSTNRYERYKFDDDINNLMLSGFLDDSGRLWFASSGGLFRYHEGENTIKQFDSGINEVNDFINKGVKSVYNDNQGNIWIGSSYEGAIQLNKTKGFVTYDGDFFIANGRENGIVNTIEEIDEHTLWIGFTQGIDVFDKDFNYLKSYNTKGQSKSNLGNGDVWKIYKDSRGKIWVGTYLGGLQQYSPIEDQFVNYGRNIGIPGQDVRDIVEDSKGNLWLAVHGYGVCRIDPTSKTFSMINENNSNLISDWTYNLLVDRHDNVWVGSVLGMSYINTIDHSVQNYTNEKGDTTSLSVNKVRALIEDSNGDLWVGTDFGLNYFNREHSNFIRLMTENGLPDNNICDILEDKHGNLWLSTQRGGLFRFNKREWKPGQRDVSKLIKSFDKHDGLPSKEFRIGAAMKTGNRLYYGGTNGITTFIPEDIHFNHQLPEVIISDLLLFNEAVTPSESSVLDKNIFAKKELVLNYTQDVVTFEFTAFNYIQPFKNNYAYMLEGFDDQWYDIGNKREVTYTNLPPGDYILRVKASNNDGYWNETGTSLRLTITPPWWSTLWFKILLIAFFTLAIYAVLWLRTRSINIQKRLLSAEVSRKTAELEKQNAEIKEMAQKVHEADQSKIRFFLNVSHEFRTPLTLINGAIESLTQQDDSKDRNKFYSYIKNGADKLLNLINEILELRKLDVNKKTLQVEHVNIEEVLDKIFETFSYMAKEQDIKLSKIFYSAPESDIWADRSIVDKVLNNLLSNAIKYTPADGEVILEASIENGKLLLEVADNGVGMSKHVQARIFDRFYSYSSEEKGYRGTGIGLALIKELVMLHKGEITVDSEEGKGTRFLVTIPVLRQDYTREELKKDDFAVIQSRHNATSSITEKDLESENNKTEEGSSNVIFILEDNNTLRTFLKDALGKTYKVHTSRNGKEAFDKLPQIMPDLILCDIMMPEMDGMAFCNKVKQNDLMGHIPIVLLTAKVEDEYKIEGFDIGADDYITKPFNLEVLKARIANLITQRTKLKTLFEGHSEIIPVEIIGNTTDEKFLDKAIMIIEKHLSNPDLGYQQFSKEMGLSKSKLYTRVGELTGQSINVFIRTVRLKIAAKMLSERDYTVAELAYAVGFSDPNYFSKSFKALFEMTPSEYKTKKMAQPS